MREVYVHPDHGNGTGSKAPYAICLFGRVFYELVSVTFLLWSPPCSVARVAGHCVGGIGSDEADDAAIE
jgi:hypothetical protein